MLQYYNNIKNIKAKAEDIQVVYVRFSWIVPKLYQLAHKHRFMQRVGGERK